MQPQTIIKTPGPASFLALVPHLIGMEPVDSLVVIPFSGKRTAGGLRVDLPARSSDLRPLTTYVASILGRLRAVDGVVVIVYCSSASDLLPHRDLIEVVLRRLSRDGLAIKDAFCVAGQDWAPYISDSGRVAFSASWASLERLDAGGLDLPELPSLLPPLVYEPAAPDVVAAVSQSVAALQEAFEGDEPFDPGLEDAIQGLPDIMEAALDWTDDEFDSGCRFVLAALQAPPARDATMLQWASDPALRERLWDEPESADLVMGIGPLPDRERLVAGIALLTKLRSVAAPSLQPPLLCMLSWLSWAMGAGTRAGEYLDAIVPLDPDYGMASVLQALETSGRVPEWLLNR